MSSSSKDICKAAKKTKPLYNKSFKKKIESGEFLNDSIEIDKIVDGVSTSTSVNNVINLSDDDIDGNNCLETHRKRRKITDYPSDLSDEDDTKLFLSTCQRSAKRQNYRRSKRVALLKDDSKKPVKDSNFNKSPLKSVKAKTKRKTKNKPPINIHSLSEVSASRGGSGNLRGHGSRNRGRQCPPSTTEYPTYNIGDIEEYRDLSEKIPLFSSKPNVQNEIVILDEDSDENEELTIYVHWQNYKVVKFDIRRFQKLKPIFVFFSKQQNVPEKRLFFAYNDVVLTCDDTPDSIKYNIANFIEGGIVSQDLVDLVREHTTNKPSGIKIKFQCQNIKRPYETTVIPNDKLSVAMLECAEHFEKPLNNLKFEFDGECISGTTTAKELELESGDCIDVRIVE